MKKMLSYVKNFVAILVGFILMSYALFRWREIGFRIEEKFFAGNRDGSFFVILIGIGIALFGYGLFDLLVFRRRGSTKN